MELILLMAIITSVGGFVTVILIHAYKEYRKEKLIKRLERQLVVQRERQFSIAELLGYNKLIERIGYRLTRAGLAKLNAEDTFLSFIVILTLVFAATTIMGLGWYSVVIVAVLAVFIPRLINMIGTRRHAKLNKQFAEAAQDIADYLKISPNLENAIRKVAEEADQPLRGGLNKILYKLDIGIGLIPALTDFSKESESMMIDFWVDSIIFAHQMRASVADVCEEVSKKINVRLKQNQQVSTKLTEIKTMMFGIAGVMAGLIFFIFSSSPEFTAALKTPIGKSVLIYTIVSYVGATLFVLQRINKEVSEL